MRYVILCLVLFCQLFAVAQRFVNIVGVSDDGDLYAQVGDIETRALLDAKRNAIASLGADEKIYRLFCVLPHEVAHQRVAFEGECEAVDRIVTVGDSRTKISTVSGVKHCEATISGSVKKVKKEKHRIGIRVTGLQDVYYNGDFMTFNVRTEGDSYIHVFVFDSNDGWKLFPIDGEPFESIKSGVSYNYPLNADTKIFLEKSNVRNKVEYNTVVIVATANPVQYTGEADFERLTEWLYAIPYNERDVCLYNIQIK